ASLNIDAAPPSAARQGERTSFRAPSASLLPVGRRRDRGDRVFGLLGLVRDRCRRRWRGRCGGGGRLWLAIEPRRQWQMMRVIAPDYENADEYQPRQNCCETAVSERYDVGDQGRDECEHPQHRDVDPVHAVPIDWYLRHLRHLPFTSHVSAGPPCGSPAPHPNLAPRRPAGRKSEKQADMKHKRNILLLFPILVLR